MRMRIHCTCLCGKMSQVDGATVSSQAARGIVKQVLSGDAAVIRGQPRGGPPPTRTVALSNILAPRLARRGNPNVEGSSDTVDEPYAWEAKEFLRKMLVGKEVKFTVEHKATNREYGTIWIAADGSNVTDVMLNEGLVEVRQAGARPSEELTRLLMLESSAKAAERGKWSKNKSTIRNITWNMTNDELRTFVQRNQGKELEAIVEFVRDGSTLRAIVIPSFIQITVAMSGIKSPMFKWDGDKDKREGQQDKSESKQKSDSNNERAEPFAEMAKFFTESRLLQQNVKLLIEGVSNQLVLATVIHPMGNIAERLLREGFARCVDWSMAMVSKGREILRAAERSAKQQQIRIWQGYKPTTAVTLPQGSRTFSGKVIEVVNGDALLIKRSDQQYQKIWFSSLRPPSTVLQTKRQELSLLDGDFLSHEARTSSQVQKEEEGSGISRRLQQQRARPLYDIPHMWEAREFLRKKLIGKKVNVNIDYIKPAQDSFPEKVCCTVTREDINIAEALISKGLAYCLRHKQDDDQRSSHYDELMAAEARAIKNGKGVHSKKEAVPHRVAELSNDPTKAKQFLPFLQRAGKTVALAEFIASGSRLRLYLPKDTCLISFLLAGISCPRAPRDDGTSGDPYGQQALIYTKDLIMQREVEIEVDTCDKGGNFIGWLFYEGRNLSISLLEEGLSRIGQQADRTVHFQALLSAEKQAKEERRNLWKDYIEHNSDEREEDRRSQVQNETPQNEGSKSCNKSAESKEVVVTEITSADHFWVQLVEQGPQFEEQMQQLQKELSTNPPIPGAFTAKKGLPCVAKYSDGLWYRAAIEKIVSTDEVHVLFIDFGNRCCVNSAHLASLPAGYGRLPQAKECFLAYVTAPSDEDWSKEALTAFGAEVQDRSLFMSVEYTMLSQHFVRLVQSADNTDVAAKLISEGLLRSDKREERRAPTLMEEYREKEALARKLRVNIWQYGDFTPDDCSEFGYHK